MDPALAVVIVTHDHAGQVVAALDALAAMRRAHDRVIVVDNASRDGTAAACRRHPAVDEVVEPGVNLGFAAGCNLGAARTTAPVLVFLNPDAVPEPGCLDALRRPPPGWAAWMGLVLLPGGREVNTAGNVVHYTGLAWAGGHGRPASEVPPHPHEVGYLSGACLAVRRDAFAALGGFPAHFFMYADDLDLSLRMRLLGMRFGIVPAARVRHDYAFARGPRKWLLLERNRWLAVLRTFPGPVLAAVAPALVAAEAATLAAAAAGGWLGPKLRADAQVLRLIPRTLRERRGLQRARACTPSSFAAGLSAELSSPFLPAAARSGPARLASRAYWRLARRLIRP